MRKHLRVRDVLVQTRSRMICLCRSLLRQEGIRVPSGECHEDVCAQLALVDKHVAQAVKDDERVQRLTTVPSVGPVTAATFIAIVDDPAQVKPSERAS